MNNVHKLTEINNIHVKEE